MEQVLVTLPPGEEQYTYKIFIGSGILENTEELFPLDAYSKILVICDKNAALSLSHLLKGLPRRTLVETVVGDESLKSIEHTTQLWEHFHKYNLDRRSLIFSLGGGALTDAVGFAASTFKRGVPFIHVPTTLLAQVDASVGGKTGINFGGVKNLIGTFQQPVSVLIDTDTLKTLPRRELASGYAELIKHGAILDREFFSLFERFSPGERPLSTLIKISCEIKARVVMSDPFERKERKLLNFGHTLGHAFESLSHDREKPLLHGEAVSLGMIGEARIAELLFETDGLVEPIKNCLQKYHLPVRLPFTVTPQELLPLVAADKKNVGTAIKWTLPSELGVGKVDVEGGEEFLGESLKVLQ